MELPVQASAALPLIKVVINRCTITLSQAPSRCPTRQSSSRRDAVQAVRLRSSHFTRDRLKNHALCCFSSNRIRGGR
eukprot:m.222604 g.222604  ORF g.222604 m.222604 type:complete len:77 (-) comp54178_c0_seq1:191-421(-)